MKQDAITITTLLYTREVCCKVKYVEYINSFGIQQGQHALRFAVHQGF